MKNPRLVTGDTYTVNQVVFQDGIIRLVTVEGYNGQGFIFRIKLTNGDITNFVFYPTVTKAINAAAATVVVNK